MSEIMFADLNTGDVETSVLTTYEQIAATTLYPGDPVRLFLESLAYLISMQNQLINLAGQQNLLAFAKDAHLDEVARMVGTVRLGHAPARATQRFALAPSGLLDFAVLIPAGTRVTTADGKLVFATLATASIKPGERGVETMVEATSPGSHANGLVPGQVCRLIDPVAYVAVTTNSSTTSGGSDIEDDVRLRARAQLAPEAFSCAGPMGAYRFQAMSAHPDIADVGIWSPKPGTVDIRPLMQGGELPDKDILDLVRTRCSADDVRPLTDTITVAAPDPVVYTLAVSWSLQKTDAPLAASVQARVLAAVERYRLWQRSAPGRDINPTKLVSLMEQAGARRVVVGFDFVQLEPRQIAREVAVDVTFTGVEDE